MKLLLVLNPIAGGVGKEEFLDYAKERSYHFGVSLDVFRTTGENDVERLRQHIAGNQPDRIGSVGGDGTFKLTVEASLEKAIPTGIIPGGSANGLARELGVPNDMYDAFDELIASRLIAKLDLLVVNGKHRCIHMGDVGLNARIVSGYEKESTRGMVGYGKQLFRALSEVEPFGFSLTMNDQEHKGDAVMLGFGNGSKFGTGIPMNTLGNPFDGKFEITVIEELNADMIFRAGLSLINETFLKEAETTVYTGMAATIELEKKQILQLDGEVIGETNQIKIEIEKGKVQLVTTQSNPYL